MKSILPLLVLLIPAVSSAAVTATGDFSGGTTPPVLSFTAPIDIFIERSGNISSFVFNEWVSGDTAPSAALSAGGSLSYKINNGATLTVAIGFIIDNVLNSSGSLTANDGVLVLGNSIPVTSGQTLTILSQSLFFTPSGPGFNQPSAPFTGVTFPVDNVNNTFSAIPEPSVSIVLAIGSLMILRRRR